MYKVEHYIQGNGPDKERILRNELKILGGVQLVVPFLPWDFNEFDTHETILNSTLCILGIFTTLFGAIFRGYEFR